MNEEQVKIDKPELVALMEKFDYLSDSRNKLIISIEETIDRLRNNRTPCVEPKGIDKSSCLADRLANALQDMDYSNERIAGIYRRLIELV
jgi:hypothetical protein